MKLRFLLTISIILTLSFSAVGKEDETKNILSAMEFPSPVLNFGSLLNDPFFAINFGESKADHSDLEKKIRILESNGEMKADPDRLYDLGNAHRDMMNYETAVKYYKKYLESIDVLKKDHSEDKKMFQLKGEVYYSLAEVDQPSQRIDNLERSLIHFTKAFDLEPASLSLWIKIGDCYLSLGRNTEAIYCYNKYIEKNINDLKILTRLQAGTFQQEYLKLTKENDIENLNIAESIDFSYIETAVNNSDIVDKESLKLQHHIYLIRLLLLKKEYYLNKMRNQSEDVNYNLEGMFSNDEKKIIDDTCRLIKASAENNTIKIKLNYLSGVVNYLKKNYEKSVSDLNKIPKNYGKIKQVYNEILYINLIRQNDYKKAADLAEEIIQINPQPEYYLILASIEFKNNNTDKAIMLCNQSLKIDEKFTEAYSGLSVLYAVKGNYIAAEEMIKKGNPLINKDDRNKSLLFYQMIVNEAAIALLKKEKEKAYILLRSVISADNNRKALELYNRYFIKK
jgi:tetratricopeptide (TPR) repeat protein